MKQALRALAVVATLVPAGVRAEPGRITVVGHATLEVPPDHASVQVGITSSGPNPGAALDANSAAAARVIAIVKQFDVGPGDLATSSVNLTQAFRSVRGSGGVTQEPDGYRADNTVRVSLRDLVRLGDLTRKVLDGGANAINGVTFGLSDPRAVEMKAGEEAVRDAAGRARTLADAAGAKLGAIESMVSPARTSRSIAFPPSPVPMVRAEAMRGTRVPLEAGTIEVSADVEMTWTLAQP